MNTCTNMELNINEMEMIAGGINPDNILERGGKGLVAGAVVGAAGGSVFPGIGTYLGGLIGATVGYTAGVAAGFYEEQKK